MQFQSMDFQLTEKSLMLMVIQFQKKLLLLYELVSHVYLIKIFMVLGQLAPGKIAPQPQN